MLDDLSYNWNLDDDRDRCVVDDQQKGAIGTVQGPLLIAPYVRTPLLHFFIIIWRLDIICNCFMIPFPSNKNMSQTKERSGAIVEAA